MIRPNRQVRRSALGTLPADLASETVPSDVAPAQRCYTDVGQSTNGQMPGRTQSKQRPEGSLFGGSHLPGRIWRWAT